MLHLKVVGSPMEQNEVENIAKKVEEAESEAIYADSDPDSILYAMLQKHVDLLKVTELKAACTAHGLKLDKKTTKKASIISHIMKQNIETVSGLVYHGLKKNCTVQDLKDILKNQRLPVSGSKDELISRLMESRGAAIPTQSLITSSKAAPKEKKSKQSHDFDDYFFSDHDVYKKDETDSKLVSVAKSGSLEELKTELSKLPKERSARTTVLNHAARWTEVQGKYGYDKSWEWFGDTALIAAARRGEVLMVKALLAVGADPTLESCPCDDLYEDATKAAEASFKRNESALETLTAGSESKVRSLLMKQSSLSKTLSLLCLATNQWTKASYSRSHYSEDRRKAFLTNPNEPRDLTKLMADIETFDTTVKIDEEKLHNLVKKFEGKSAQGGVEQVMYSWDRVKPKPQGLYRAQTGLVTQTAGYSRQCVRDSCIRISALDCTQAKCGVCCNGPCNRHGK